MKAISSNKREGAIFLCLLSSQVAKNWYHAQEIDCVTEDVKQKIMIKSNDTVTNICSISSNPVAIDRTVA